MRNLIIIGNGFDLAHGLKTSYKDFLLWYLNGFIRKFEKTITAADDCLEAEARYLIIFNDGLSYKSLKELFNATSKNDIRFKPKSKFIEAIIYEYASGNWVDIENIFYKSLIITLEGLPTDPLGETKARFNAVKAANASLSFITQKLTEYLKCEIIGKAARNPYISKLFGDITGANSKADNLAENNQVDTLIVNFNYTDTINLYGLDIGLKNDRSKLISIHGQIDSQANPVIFGYGDEQDPKYPYLENLNVNSALNHIKSFHYMKTDNYLQLNRFINSNAPFTVHIMGHSCGISDRVLLSTIFEHKNCNLIKIHYHLREDGTNDFFEKTQEISRHFKASNKSIMRERIVPFDQCKPLT